MLYRHFINPFRGSSVILSTILKHFYCIVCIAYPFDRHQNFIMKYNLYEFCTSLVVRIRGKINVCI